MPMLHVCMLKQLGYVATAWLYSPSCACARHHLVVLLSTDVCRAPCVSWTSWCQEQSNVATRATSYLVRRFDLTVFTVSNDAE